MKNSFRIVGGVVFVLALLLFLSVFQGVASVSAQGPTATPTPGASPTPAQAPPAAPPAAATNLDDPTRAVKFGSTIQNVPTGGAQWYQFDYTTKGQTIPRPDVTVALLNGVSNGLKFEVYSPEDIQSVWFDRPPVGRGTPFVIVDCTNSTDNSGHCLSNDLTWKGGFGLDGPVFVRVINDTGKEVAPQLVVAGSGLAACENAQPAAPAPAAANQPFAAIQCGTSTVVMPAPTSGG